MKILVINCGSSSLKYQLFNMETAAVLARGVVERIGEAQAANWRHSTDAGQSSGTTHAPDHEAAFAHMVEKLLDPAAAAVKSLEEINAVGHRVVHGGEQFVAPARINDDVIAAVRALCPLAPLHNPPNLAGIIAARRRLPDVPHVAVFDTAFHQTMPPAAFHYGIPYEFYEKHRVRRYGFHGTSHRYVARYAARKLGRKLSQFTAITCHLGNGCSIAAIREGKSVDTTMGLTPLEGLLMGTRCGDIDPGALFYLVSGAGVPFEKLDALLNKSSGMLGVSGVSNDARSLWEAADKGNARARLALEMFAYRARKYIGAYLAVLNGCEAIVFTGGIGERDVILRRMICENLDALGVKLDTAANEAAFAREAVVSAPDSRVKLLVIPTNEELEIAEETAPFVRNAPDRAPR